MLKAIFPSLLLGASIAALAGTPDRLADGHGLASEPVYDTTLKYFPQIEEVLRPGSLRPLNPKLSPGIASGPANNLPIGSLVSNSRTDVTAKFPGMSNTGWTPPDPYIAVGPSHIVEVVNSSIAIFNKSGQKQFQQVLDGSGFFSGAATSSFVFDPKCFYDPGSNRFFVVALEQDDSPQISGILIAISDDGDPNGSWVKYRLEAKVNKNGTNYWFDYPCVGYNKNGVVITGNMFSFGSNSFLFSRSYVLIKSELVAGGTVHFSFFDHTGEFTIQPARCFEGVTSNLYGARIKNTSTFTFYAWKNANTLTPTLSQADVTIPSFISFNGYAQSTGGGSLDTISDRLMDATFRSGSFLVGHTVKFSPTDNRSMVRWYEFLVNSWPTSGVVTRKQSGNIGLAAPNYLFIPAIAKNGVGGISVIMTRSSTTRTADFYGVSHKSTDALNTMGPLSAIASSLHSGQPQSRWGDFYCLTFDPSDSKRFWAVGEVLDGTGQWRTEVGSWIVP
ncbi:MAG: hypothetical protein JSS66_13925 [Armatimonadetes bacterium]|nr:hypothetical protein [Armatimonadota bacterium]